MSVAPRRSSSSSSPRRREGSSTAVTSSRLSKEAKDELFLRKNRLEKLKLDEQRLSNRINLTDQQLHALESRREQFQKEQRLKQKHKLQAERQLTAAREAVKSEQERRKAHAEELRRRNEAQKRCDFEEVQHMKKINECLIHIQREDEMKKILERRAETRKLEGSVRERMARHSAARLQSVKHSITTEIERSDEERGELLTEIEKLAKEEEAMLNRIDALRVEEGRKKEEYVSAFGMRSRQSDNESNCSSRQGESNARNDAGDHQDSQAVESHPRDQKCADEM